jgi:hypothetical protein
MLAEELEYSEILHQEGLSIQYTHCFGCWASLTGPVFVTAPRSICLLLKMLLTVKRFPVSLNFSEIPLTYWIMTVPSYIVSEEGRLLLDGFVMDISEHWAGYRCPADEAMHVQYPHLIKEDVTSAQQAEL